MLLSLYFCVVVVVLVVAVVDAVVVVYSPNLAIVTVKVSSIFRNSFPYKNSSIAPSFVQTLNI